MKIHHFYHIYSNGNWQTPFREHVEALRHSGLINNLDSFHIGIVGNEQSRESVKSFIRAENLNALICCEVDDGWEQETLDKLLEFSKENDGLVLYAHTKNAVNINDLHLRWRKSMTYHNVINWQKNVDVLTNKDDVYHMSGCHYLEIGNEGRVDKQTVNIIKGFMAGNYWWSKLEYIRLLEPSVRISRYYAEIWVSNLKDVFKDDYKAFDFDPIHPGCNRFITQW
jgi:hypothetical protein